MDIISVSLSPKYVNLLPEDSDYGEELERVCVVDVRGHLLQQQVDVEAQRRHVVDYVHAANKKAVFYLRHRFSTYEFERYRAPE